MVARKYGITRREQDEMAVESHAKAHEATQKGLFKDEILSIEADVPQEDGSTKKMVVDRDQGIRSGTTMETLAKLEPVFIKDEKGTVTGRQLQSDQRCRRLCGCRKQGRHAINSVSNPK